MERIEPNPSTGLTPFFCQNQMSEYMDGLLPKSRVEEVDKILKRDKECEQFFKELQSSIEVARLIPPRPMSHDLTLRIVEATEAGRKKYRTRQFRKKTLLFVSIPLLVFGTLVSTFPSFFPWLQNWNPNQGADYVRYFPLLQGAGEVVEEQTTWLSLKEPFKVSVWEEGGLSPEEFEKSFQNRGGSSSPDEDDKSSDSEP